MKVVLKKEKKIFEFEESMKVEELIKRLGLTPPDAYVVYRKNGKLVKREEVIDSKEEVEIFPIVSGG